MPDLHCAVPGCSREGRNRLGIRCRVAHDGPSPVPGKGKTDALWAPDADAYLCDEHALSGANVTILFEPDDSREITVKVIGAMTASERTIEIKQ
jgi:hypothetical protein